MEDHDEHDLTGLEGDIGLEAHLNAVHRHRLNDLMGQPSADLLNLHTGEHLAARTAQNEARWGLINVLAQVADTLQNSDDERAQEAYPHLCTAIGILSRPPGWKTTSDGRNVPGPGVL